MLAIWFLGTYLLIFIVLANLEVAYFHYIPKKYGIEYPKMDGVAINFFPTKRLIQKSLEKYKDLDVEKVLIKLLRFHNFTVRFGNIFIVLLILFVVVVLILKD